MIFWQRRPSISFKFRNVTGLFVSGKDVTAVIIDVTSWFIASLYFMRHFQMSLCLYLKRVSVRLVQ